MGGNSTIHVDVLHELIYLRTVIELARQASTLSPEESVSVRHSAKRVDQRGARCAGQ